MNQGATCLEDGLKKFAGETCTSNDECHTNICDTSGTYHGCQGKCVRTAPELFPNPNGWLMKFEPKEDGGLSETWRDFNCPEYQDHLYNHMWMKVRGIIGTWEGNNGFMRHIRCFQFWYRKTTAVATCKGHEYIRPTMWHIKLCSIEIEVVKSSSISRMFF